MPFLARDKNGKIIEQSWNDVIEEERIRKEKRKVKKDGDYISIEIPECSGSTYDIPMDRLTNPNQALDWIHQLSSKTWMKGGLLEDFIEVIFENIPVKWWSGA